MTTTPTPQKDPIHKGVYLSVLLVIGLTIVFGFLVPNLISHKSDWAVIAGLLLTFLSLYGGIYMVQQIIKTVNNNN